MVLVILCGGWGCVQELAYCAGVCSAVGAHGWNINEWVWLCCCLLLVLCPLVVRVGVCPLLGVVVGAWNVGGWWCGWIVWHTVGS